MEQTCGHPHLSDLSDNPIGRYSAADCRANLDVQGAFTCKQDHGWGLAARLNGLEVGQFNVAHAARVRLRIFAREPRAPQSD